MTQFDSFVQFFIKRFHYQGTAPRTIGIEKEVLAVDEKGYMADLTTTLWPAVKKSGKYPMLFDDYYTRAITGYSLGKELVTTDAGLGTFEFILMPAKTIQEAEKNMNKIYKSISPFLRKFHFVMLGLSYQPLTKKNPHYWNKKQRYEVLKNYFKSTIDFACLSAADQVHLDLTVDEIMPAFGVFNKLNGFFLSLLGNSPIKEGKLFGGNEYREILWDFLGKKRTGIPQKEFPSLLAYLDYVWKLPCIMAKKGRKYFSPDIPFKDFAKGMSDQELQQQFMYHEGTTWFSSRPRVYGTLEIRPCGLQPFPQHLVVSALSLGLMEKLPELVQFMNQFSWEICREFRYEGSRKGLGAKISGKPVAPYLKELVHLSEEGLKERGKGEEKYLAPLHHILKTKENPADEALALFKKGGIKALIKKRGFLV